MYEQIVNLAKKNLKALNLKCQGKVSEYAFAVADIRHDLSVEPIQGIDREAVSASAKDAMCMTATGLSLKAGVGNEENVSKLAMVDELFAVSKKLYPTDKCAAWCMENVPALWAQYEATLNSALVDSRATTRDDVVKAVQVLEQFHAEHTASAVSSGESAKAKAERLARQSA